MDEAAAAAAITEDGEDTRPHDGDGASENNVGSSAEDTADVNQFSLACKDCGLKFTHLEVFKTHLHQHALEEEEEEEEEEAQMEDNRNPASELDSGSGDNGKSRDEDTGGDADQCEMQTQPSGSAQGVGVTSLNNELRKIYTCLVCGKIYTYLVSFQKHQQLHGNQPSSQKKQSVPNLRKYECPDCGLSFIRKARLLGHLRVHRSRGLLKPELLRCDQCNKDFTSAKSWMAHVEIHQQKPFWCLTCAKGFIDEVSLDRHLQGHSLRKHACNICHKSFQVATHLNHHYNIHTGAKPYQCTFCGKSFSSPKSLISHRKKHHRAYVGSSGMTLGIKHYAMIAKKRVLKKKRPLLTIVKEEPEMETNMEGKEKHMETVESQKPSEDAAEFGDHEIAEDSDCGEPVHYIKPSKPLGSAGSDPPDESKSETAEPQAGQGLEESESRMHREHKYWEWECCECDMGFDEVAKLHLHYMKHATGELPVPQDDIED